jgi:hypothetical protein
MKTRQELERRVRELEAEVAGLRAYRGRVVRYRSAAQFGGLPLIAIATGPDPAKGEARGHARGILAIGDMATGVVAVGGLARGLAAFGGLALGLVTFGGASFGALAAVGGLAVGSIAFGGGALGWTAVGGGAVGTYACGGGALGEHVIDATRRDPEAAAHFARLGLGFACPPERPRRGR